MHLTLEEILIINSVLSLGLHVIVGARWLLKNGVQVEKKALITLHVKNKHPARLGKCQVDDCITIMPQKYQEALPQLESQR